MANLGFFTSEQEKAFAQLIDDAIKAKGLVELVDGYAARVVVRLIDDNLAEKQIIQRFNIDEALVTDIQAIADQVLEGDYNEAADIGSGVLNDLIDIPGLSEDAEGMLFRGALEMLIGAVKLASQPDKSDPDD